MWAPMLCIRMNERPCALSYRGAGGRFSPQYNATNQRLASNLCLFAKQQQTFDCVRWVNPGSRVLQIIVCEGVVHNKGRLHEGGGRADADRCGHRGRGRGVARGAGANRPGHRVEGAPMKPTISTKLLFYRIIFSLFLTKIIVNWRFGAPIDKKSDMIFQKYGNAGSRWSPTTKNLICFYIAKFCE